MLNGKMRFVARRLRRMGFPVKVINDTIISDVGFKCGGPAYEPIKRMLTIKPAGQEEEVDVIFADLSNIWVADELEKMTGMHHARTVVKGDIEIATMSPSCKPWIRRKLRRDIHVKLCRVPRSRRFNHKAGS